MPDEKFSRKHLGGTILYLTALGLDYLSLHLDESCIKRSYRALLIDWKWRPKEESLEPFSSAPTRIVLSSSWQFLSCRIIYSPIRRGTVPTLSLQHIWRKSSVQFALCLPFQPLHAIAAILDCLAQGGIAHVVLNIHQSLLMQSKLAQSFSQEIPQLRIYEMAE